MDENQHVEVHYVDSNYSYPASEGNFMDFFGGVPAPAPPFHYVNTGLMHNQETGYWSMHMNSYKYGPESTSSYYGLYEGSDHASRMDFNRRAWEYPSMTTIQEPIAVDIPSEQNAGPSQNTVMAENTVSAVQSTPEECSPDHEDADDSEVVWQDEIDPDTMTYEELLDLGETVGTESRGLSQELIDRLPTTKHKSGGIFSRKKSADR